MAAQLNSSLMTVAVISLLVPAAFVSPSVTFLHRPLLTNSCSMSIWETGCKAKRVRCSCN